MLYINFKKMNNIYSLMETKYIEENILGLFLSSDVGSDALNWIKWINETKQPFTSSNASWLEIEDNLIYIGDLCMEEKEDEPCFSISKEKFIKMLEDWDAITKQKPNQIFLTIDDDGNIKFEAKNDESI